MPASPADRAAATVDPPPTLYRCSVCGEPHQPFPMPAGLASAYTRVIAGDPDRPEPLGRHPHADTASLVRDAFNPWRGRHPEEPPGPSMTLRDRLAYLWHGDT